MSIKIYNKERRKQKSLIMFRGILYLIPATLGETTNPFLTILGQIPKIIESLDGLIVENKKSARNFIKSLRLKKPVQQILMLEFNKKSSLEEREVCFESLRHGGKWGLMSEAGSPCIADPGSVLVRFAHENKIRVAPLVGPSAILLALMGSGLTGQRFCFHGYLPIDRKERKEKIRELERESERNDQTQIFMETPYRNQQFLQALLQFLSSDTDLCLAVDLTLDSENIMTKSVSQWRKDDLPNLHKKSVIFLIHKGIFED